MSQENSEENFLGNFLSSSCWSTSGSILDIHFFCARVTQSLGCPWPEFKRVRPVSENPGCFDRTLWELTKYEIPGRVLSNLKKLASWLERGRKRRKYFHYFSQNVLILTLWHSIEILICLSDRFSAMFCYDLHPSDEVESRACISRLKI